MLNPPIIDGKLPAQYGNTLTFQYTDNRAVSSGEYTNLKAKIKTTSINSVVAILTSTGKSGNFELPNNILTIGQYYKIQLCYSKIVEEEKGIDGQYSTVGIFKYTDEPTIELEEPVGSEIQGKYTTKDLTEKVEKYKFDVYDNGELIETSGWLFHDADTDEITTTEGLVSIDTYTIKTLRASENIKVSYDIITTNSLQIPEDKKPSCSVLQGYTFTEDTDIKLTPNIDSGYNDDNGYITVKYEGEENIDTPFILLRSIDHNTWETITNNFNKNFTDKTVEQGVRYYYAIGRDKSYIYNSTICDFEDILLSDSKRQLKIRFNPKISSFKNTIQETKQDTIGGAYPIFFRNGRLKYKEFQISGLISLLMDEPSDSNMRVSTNASKDEAISNNFATNLTGQNIYNERKFKLEVLEWLTNGELKLFRSPTEGNYIIRIMNVSMSPEDTLGRMIHNFSATAYEAQELNLENLRALGFFLEEANQ